MEDTLNQSNSEEQKEVLRIKNVVDPGFVTTMNKIIQSDIPMLTAFKLDKSLKKVNDIISTYNKVRLESLKKHSVLKEDGELDTDISGNVKFKDSESAQSFFQEERKLLMEEIDLGSYRLEEMGNKIQLSVVDVSKIRLLFDPNSIPS